MMNYERPTTTFWMDFTIADKFGINAIKDTFNRAFREWKIDYKMITELSMVLNHKCWSYYEVDEALCSLYSQLFYKVHEWAIDNLKGDALKHYLAVTD